MFNFELTTEKKIVYRYEALCLLIYNSRVLQRAQNRIYDNVGQCRYMLATKFFVKRTWNRKKLMWIRAKFRIINSTLRLMISRRWNHATKKTAIFTIWKASSHRTKKAFMRRTDWKRSHFLTPLLLSINRKRFFFNNVMSN